MEIKIKIPQMVIDYCKANGVVTEEGIKSVYNHYIAHMLSGTYGEDEVLFESWTEGDGGDYFKS